jgi:integrase/recombinase XerD
MTPLAGALDDYLKLRRGLGYELTRDEPELVKFVVFLEANGAGRVTTDLALEWAKMPASQHPINWRRRLSRVRGFARYVATIDPTSEIPPADLLPAHQPRLAPYIYTEEEIGRLMVAARTLPRPLGAATYETVIGLMATTGLRLREALALDRCDVDLVEGVLDIRATSNHRPRLVPLHPATTAALARYEGLRDEHRPEPTTPAFFVTSWGRRPVISVFRQTFRGLIHQAGLYGRGSRVCPRPHDLRHSFAVRTVIGWYRAGEDVDAKMPGLSTYLGHVSPESTYWYLQAVPELLELVSERLGAMGEVLS